MARRIVHQLVDDLDGTVLDIGSGETVLFSLDGVAYEIDLREDNAEALRDALAPFIDAGRSVSAGRSTSARGTGAVGRKKANPTNYAPIRAWAADNGYTLSDRGRVPATVIEAYEAAH